MRKFVLTCADPGRYFHDCVDCQHRETCDYFDKKEVKSEREKKRTGRPKANRPKA